jgi:hypothetical protein
MERLVQLLDDLDDLIAAIGLFSERIRKVYFSLLLTCVVVAVQAGGIWLALNHRPLASALAMLLFVALLYRRVTSPQPPLVRALS